MSTRNFALIFGIVFLVVGIAGFIPGVSQPLHEGHPPIMGNGGQLLGLFPVNELHNAVHILFGIWGLAASRSLGGAVNYARGVGDHLCRADRRRLRAAAVDPVRPRSDSTATISGCMACSPWSRPISAGSIVTPSPPEDRTFQR